MNSLANFQMVLMIAPYSRARKEGNDRGGGEGIVWKNFGGGGRVMLTKEEWCNQFPLYHGCAIELLRTPMRTLF